VVDTGIARLIGIAEGAPEARLLRAVVAGVVMEELGIPGVAAAAGLKMFLAIVLARRTRPASAVPSFAIEKRLAAAVAEIEFASGVVSEIVHATGTEVEWAAQKRRAVGNDAARETLLAVQFGMSLALGSAAVHKIEG
jgi:hypothetical protein